MNIVVVGAGYFSRFHLNAWKRIDGAVLAAIVDQDTDKANQFAKEYGARRYADRLEDVIDNVDIDWIDIITPPATHHKLVALAAECGVNVICQKPLAPTLDEAQAIAALADEAAIKLVVHENFRFQPWYRAMHSIIQRGELGAILGATFRLRPGDGRGNEAYLARQPYFRSMERFLVHETLIHQIDCFRYLFGEIIAVSARLRRLNPVIAGEDSAIVILEHATGMETVIDGNRLSSHKAANPRLTMGELIIDGMNAVLTMNGDADIRIRGHDGLENRHNYQWNDIDFGGDCVFNLIRHVVDHTQHGSPLENTANDYLSNVRIEEAIYQSHDLGRRVVIDHL